LITDELNAKEFRIFPKFGHLVVVADICNPKRSAKYPQESSSNHGRTRICSPGSR